MQLAGGMTVGLGGAAVQHRLAFEAPPFPSGRFPAKVGAEPVQFLADTLVHFAAALGELGQHLRIDTDHLGNPIHRLVPFDSEAAGQLGPQPGVIQPRQGPLIHLQCAGIERQPTPIRSLDTVGDHRMGMQLRVEATTRVLTEHPHNDAFGIHTHHMPAPPYPRVRLGLDPVEHRVDGSVMRLGHLSTQLLVADTEQNRHRLRRRKRRIESPHRVLPEAATQPLPCSRMQSGHHRQERLIVDDTIKTQHPDAASEPATRRLPGVQVVRRELLGVVATRLGTFERGHPHCHGATPTLSPQVCTRLSSKP